MESFVLFLILIGVGFWVWRGYRRGRARAGSGASHGSGVVTLEPSGDADFDVVGESFYQDALARAAGPKTKDGMRVPVVVRLEPDDGNRHDANAVRVVVDGRQVGGLSRRDAAEYRQRMASLGLKGRVAQCAGVIEGGWLRKGRDEGHYGIKLDLEWPVEVWSADDGVERPDL